MKSPMSGITGFVMNYYLKDTLKIQKDCKSLKV